MRIRPCLAVVREFFQRISTDKAALGSLREKIV